MHLLAARGILQVHKMMSLCAVTESVGNHGSEMRTQPAPEFPCSGAWRCLTATRQGSLSGARTKEMTHVTQWSNHTDKQRN